MCNCAWFQDGGKAQTLAVPAAGFRGGGNLGQGPNLGYPKTENSTDLTHYFLGWTQSHFRKKIKITNKSFLGALGGGAGAKDMMLPSWALGGGHGWVAPLGPILPTCHHVRTSPFRRCDVPMSP